MQNKLAYPMEKVQMEGKRVSGCTWEGDSPFFQTEFVGSQRNTTNKWAQSYNPAYSQLEVPRVQMALPQRQKAHIREGFPAAHTEQLTPQAKQTVDRSQRFLLLPHDPCTKDSQCLLGKVPPELSWQNSVGSCFQLRGQP